MRETLMDRTFTMARWVLVVNRNATSFSVHSATFSYGFIKRARKESLMKAVLELSGIRDNGSRGTKYSTSCL